jgi:hypothetical protein
MNLEQVMLFREAIVAILNLRDKISYEDFFDEKEI